MVSDKYENITTTYKNFSLKGDSYGVICIYIATRFR